jgi:hypothetical protein
MSAPPSLWTTIETTSNRFDTFVLIRVETGVVF